MLRKNPFQLKVLPVDAPFCNRVKELKELAGYGYSGTSAVVYSPRREGKTSLVNRVQNRLSEEGCITVKTDFFSVFSIDDIASRLAKAVFTETKRHESWYLKAINTIKSFRPVFQPDPSGGVSLSITPASGKTGFDLLEDVMNSLQQLAETLEHPVNIFIDEFQEIADLKESAKIEATLRTYMQETKASFFFVGSRRRILFDMFNEKSRPFYRMAVNYPVYKIEQDELAKWIEEQFQNNGVICGSLSKDLVKLAHSHTYYVQKLGMLAFSITDTTLTAEILKQAYIDMLESEKTVFEESYLKPLAPSQRNLLIALAKENTAKPLAKDYVKRNNLPATSTIQSAIVALLNHDLIQMENGIYTLVDKVFQDYLISTY